MAPTPDSTAPARGRLGRLSGGVVAGLVAALVVAVMLATVAFAGGSRPGVWLGLTTDAHHAVPGAAGGTTTTSPAPPGVGTGPGSGGGPIVGGAPTSVTAAPVTTAVPTTATGSSTTPTTRPQASTTSTAPGPATVTVTEADYGRQVTLRRGDRLVAQLSGPAAYTWTEPASTNDLVLHRTAGSPGTTATATFVATADGQASVTATANPNCLAAGCRPPSRLLQVDVSVVG